MPAPASPIGKSLLRPELEAPADNGAAASNLDLVRLGLGWADRLTETLARKAETFNLSKLEWQILFCVEAEPGINTKELSHRADLRAAHVSGILTRLAGRGFVTRSIDQSHRRRIEVRLTGEGERIVRTVLAAAAQLEDQLLEPLTLPQRRLFGALIGRCLLRLQPRQCSL